MNFDKILICFSVWSLLLVYQEPLQSMKYLKINTTLIFTDFCPVLYVQEEAV